MSSITYASFSDVESTADVANTSSFGEVAWGDCEEDGDQDFYVPNNNSEANALYLNNGDGTFTDVAGTFSVNDAQDVVGVG